MGNSQSTFKHSFYITKVSNLDLPLVPFVHLITGYNNNVIGDTSPLALKEILKTQDLTLDVYDLLVNKSFRVTIPKFINTQELQEPKLGINVVKVREIPLLLKIQVLSIKESSETDLQIGDSIIGIEGEYAEDEDSLINEIKDNINSKLVVIRNKEVITVTTKGSEIGCELGMGLIYSPKKDEIYIKGYTGRIPKMYHINNTESREKNSNERLSVVLGDKEACECQNVNTEKAKDSESTHYSNLNQGNDTDNQNSSGFIHFPPVDYSVSSTQSEPVYTNENSKLKVNHNLSETDLSSVKENVPIEQEPASLDYSNSLNLNQSSGREQTAQPQTEQESFDNCNIENTDKDQTDNYTPLPTQPSTQKQNSLNLEKRTGSYVYRSPKSSKEQVKINSPIDNSSRIYSEAQVPPEEEFFQGQKSEIKPKEENVAKIDGSSLVTGSDINSEGRTKDEVFDKKKKEFENLNKLFEDTDDSLPFDSPKDSTPL